jgi:hypothetical protein
MRATTKETETWRQPRSGVAATRNRRVISPFSRVKGGLKSHRGFTRALTCQRREFLQIVCGKEETYG